MNPVYVLVFHLCTVLAKGLSSSVGASCLYSLNNVAEYAFCEDIDITYESRCKNQPFLGSMLLCIETYSTEVDELFKAYQFLHDTCKSQANIRYSFKEFQEMLKNATDNIHPDEGESEEDYSKGVYYPVNVTNSSYQRSYTAVKGVTTHRLMSTRYGEILIGYWLVVLSIVTVFNIVMWTMPRYVKSFNFKWVRWFRRHIIVPQLIKEKSNGKSSSGRSLRTKISQLAPTRIQSMAMFGYFLLIIIFCVIEYKYVEPNPIYVLLSMQKKVYIAIRCGVLATTQLPIMFLFANRNNPFIVLTGMPYRTFNIFHKWIARFIFVLVVLHSFLYLDFVMKNGDYMQRWQTTKFQAANVGLSSIFLLMLFSFFKLRQHLYEVFKAAHLVLAIAFIVGAYYHCYTLGWMEYIYASIGIWAYDYMMRIKKILLTGGIVYGECQVVTDQLTNKPHSIKVVIEHSGWWRSFSGSYVYIYFMKRDMFWQSHPFTVIEANPEHYNKLVLNIRVKNGLTKVLANWLVTQPDSQARVPLIIEGPYGSTLAVNGYDNALFVAGGIGFTIVYTHAMDLARMFKSKRMRNNYNLLTSQKPIHMIWLIPNTSFIQTNMQEIINMMKMGLIQLDIYITRGCEPGPLVANFMSNSKYGTAASSPIDSPTDPFEKDDEVFYQVEENTESTKMADRPESINGLSVSQSQSMELLIRNKLPCNVTYERPSVRELINAYIEDITGGTTAIVSCGPDPMNYEARLTTTKSLKRDAQRIDYFEEKLLW